MQPLVYTGTMVKMALDAKYINRNSDTHRSWNVSHVDVCEKHTRMHAEIFKGKVQSIGSVLS